MNKTQQMLTHTPCLLINAAARFGKNAMIDFGLAGLFERFEGAFGKRLTWWLTVLIGMAIAAACLSLIFSAITSFYSFTRNTLVSDEGGREAMNALAVFGLFVLGILVVANAVNGLTLRRVTRRSEEMQNDISFVLDNAEKVSDETQARLDRAEKVMEMISSLTGEIEELYNKLKDLDDGHQSPKGNGSGTQH